MENCLTTGVVLIQIGTGLLGSLIAGLLIALISEKRFNQVIKRSESNITSALDPINKTVFTIAEKTKRLPELVPAISTIGNEIKRLAEVVDRMREGLEKAK
jgi:hypothetical protein